MAKAATDKAIAVARVYAEALFELAREKGEARELREELDELARLYETDEGFRAFVDSPLIEVGERGESLERLFRGEASDLLVDSLQVLNRKERIELLPEIAESYARLQDAHEGRVAVRVTSAVPLTDEQRERLREAVSRGSGRRAVLEESVRPQLLGGLVVKIGDRQADASVARELANINRALLGRAAREVGKATRPATDGTGDEVTA